MSLVKEASQNGCRKEQACKDMAIGLKTLQRWEKNILDQRHGPKTVHNKLTQDEKNKVIEISTSKEYCDLTPWQIVPRLVDKGTYIASESSFYRILKEQKMLTHRSKSRPKQHQKPKALIATSANEIWSWDITYLRGPIIGSFYYLYMYMDIYSRKIVGWQVHERESMELSSQLVEEICKKEGVLKSQLTIHSDNGGSMKGATMLATLQRLGVVPSFSRPSVSNDNPFSESLFKTLKYCPQYPTHPFESIEAARAWVKQFVYWYNHIHLHSGIKFVTPNDRHQGADKLILQNRKSVYEKAKQNNPKRWSKNTRNWNFIEKVYLNHLKGNEKYLIKQAA
jgi:putative transposase